MNGITFSDEEWDGIYQAMQLKRAVEGINRNVYALQNYDGSWTVGTRGNGDPVRSSSLAAALIALAGEGNE